MLKNNGKRMTEIYGTGSLRQSAQQPVTQSEMLLENHIQNKKVKFLHSLKKEDIKSNKLQTGVQVPDQNVQSAAEVEDDDDLNIEEAVEYQIKKRLNQIDSDYDDNDEEELKEEVGDLPPKIEDLQVIEYDDDDTYQFGRGGHIKIESCDEEDEENNDAPTVVIDTSMDDQDIAAQE